MSSAFRQRYKIDYSSPLEQHNTLGGKAFAAKDTQESDSSIYALVQDAKVPFRSKLVSALQIKPVDNLICPLDSGVVPLKTSSGKTEHLVFIFNRPKSISILGVLGGEKVNDNFIKKRVLPGLLIALAGIHGRGLTHRSIRPENIFFADAEASSVLLGECVTTPPALMQQIQYETLSRSLSSGFARGDGTPEDDMFALGATIMALVGGGSLAKGMDQEELFQNRVRKSSYQTLKGNKNISANMEMLLRGLLKDNIEERWTIEDVAKWVDGTKPSSTNTESPFALSRPVGFLGVNHTDRRTLAQAFAQDPEKACDVLRPQDFGAWVSQGFSGENFTERTESLLGADNLEALPPGSAGEVRFITRLCAFIDPWGPIRYSGLTMNLDGLAHAVAFAYQSEDATTLEVVEDLFSSGLVTIFLVLAGEHCIMEESSYVAVKKMADYCKVRSHGQGFERVLYELNPSLPCQSPKLNGLWVSTAKEAVVAIDKLIGSSGSGTGILDDHFRAFCQSKGGEIGQLFSSIRGGDLPRGSGALNFMEAVGAIQKKYKIASLPHLSKYLCQSLKPVIEGMHLASRKKMLLKNLDRLGSEGNLAKIQSQLNLSKHLEQDHQEFMGASGKFKQLEAERKSLQSKVSADNPYSVQQGYSWAAALGMLVAFFSAFTFMAGG